MNKPELKQLIKECIVEVQKERYIENRKFLLKRGEEIIKRIKEIGKKEFGI